MRGSASLPFVAVLVAQASSAPTFAQVWNPPNYYVWADYPATYTQTPQVRKMVRFNLHNKRSSSDPWYYESQQQLAEDLAEYIHAEIAAGRLASNSAGNTITVVLQNFAWDNSTCDGVNPSASENQLADSSGNSTRMFQSADIANDDPTDLSGGDRLPGLDEWLSQSSLFPVARIDNAAPESQIDLREARAYRHPFIKNALEDAGATTRAPLRAWMKKFVHELDVVYQARLGTPDEIPSPEDWRWYMDCEPIFALASSKNAIFKLMWLCDPSSVGGSGSSSTYWTNPNYQIPGPWFYDSLLGRNRTLGEQYDYDQPGVGSYGYPNLPSTFLDPTSFLKAEHPHNNAVATWYHQLCLQVQDWVMYNCFYSVLQDQWPAVRCGNYNDFNTDGAPDRFGWFDHREWNTSVALSNDDTSGSPTSIFGPREDYENINLNTARGGPMYYHGDPAASGDDHGRFYHYYTRASCTSNHPVCYPLDGYELFGWDAVPGEMEDPYVLDRTYVCCWTDGPYNAVGWNRRNFYNPITPGSSWNNESKFETSLRVHRQNLESTINSGQELVAPWALMTDTGDSAHPEASVFFERSTDSQRLYALFRSKNLADVLLWTNWYAQTDHPEFATNLQRAWDSTQEVVRRVYSPRVTKYTRVYGTTGTYADTGETQAQKSARLEFTLRDSGGDREVEQFSKPLPSPGSPPTRHQTTLQVDFEWTDDFSDLPRSGQHLQSATPLNLIVEHSVAYNESAAPWTSNTDIKVQVWQVHPPAASQWVTTPVTIHYSAPISATDGRYRHRQFVELGTPYPVYLDTTVTPPVYRTKLRFVEQSDLTFTSRYDLVQLIPQEFVQNIEESMMRAEADLNSDGIVDEGDLDMFIDEWLDSSPAADIDGNEAVDTLDADRFLESYLNES